MNVLLEHDKALLGHNVQFPGAENLYPVIQEEARLNLVLQDEAPGTEHGVQTPEINKNPVLEELVGQHYVAVVADVQF